MHCINLPAWAVGDTVRQYRYWLCIVSCNERCSDATVRNSEVQRGTVTIWCSCPLNTAVSSTKASAKLTSASTGARWSHCNNPCSRPFGTDGTGRVAVFSVYFFFVPKHKHKHKRNGRSPATTIHQSWKKKKEQGTAAPQSNSSLNPLSRRNATTCLLPAPHRLALPSSPSSSPRHLVPPPTP